jgi:hypothetical protein
MEREELGTLPLEHPWTAETLRNHFAAVMGGVAYPGRRPGHAIVAGLCHSRDEDDFEAHVLQEAESPDLGELLRACRGLGKRYRPAGMPRNELFRWAGDGEHVGANRIIWRLNEEPDFKYDQLTVQTTTLIDGPQPYLSMLAMLWEYTRPGRKRLYLHNSKAAFAMNDIPPDEVADARVGDFPAVEALAFVVDGLRSWLDYRPTEMVGDTNPYRRWRRFSRRRPR